MKVAISSVKRLTLCSLLHIIENENIRRGESMNKHTGMYFKKISERLERRANENRSKDDITFTQGKVLWFLHKKDGEDVTLRDIEKFLDCSHATVSGIVSRLEEKGLLTLETNAADRRAKTVRVTEKEKRNFRAMQERRKVMEETLLKGFSDDERHCLLSYLERVYRNLEE